MKLTLALFLGAAGTVLAGQEVLKAAENPLDESFRSFALETLETWHVPGLAIAVVEGADTFSTVSRVRGLSIVNSA